MKLNYLFIFFVLLGCSKTTDDFNNHFVDYSEKPYYVLNGVLHVKDFQTLDSLDMSIREMTIESRKKWEDSIGLSTYFTLYNHVLTEYEVMVSRVEATKSDKPYFEFREIYNNYVTFNDGLIEDCPDRSIEPKYSLLCSLLNEYGVIVVGDDRLFDFKYGNLKQAPNTECYQKTSSRRMRVRVMIGKDMTPIVNVLSCQKKVLGAWWNYTSNFYVHTNAYHLTHELRMDTGKVAYMHQSKGATTLEVWNNGVGFSKRCIYNIN